MIRTSQTGPASSIKNLEPVEQSWAQLQKGLGSGYRHSPENVAVFFFFFSFC